MQTYAKAAASRILCCRIQGLEISVPRFVLDRPSGERQPALVQPDIVLPDSPFDNQAMVKALLRRLARNMPP
jgi:hypothetical protein